MILLNLLITLATSFCAGAQSTVDILDPAILQKLDVPEQFSFATVLGEHSAEKTFLANRATDPQLSQLQVLRLKDLKATGNAKYLAIESRLTEDVIDLKRLSREPMAFSSEEAEDLAPAGNVARHFDFHWLSSRHAAFPLIAVVNRIDKRDVYSGTCGELRFIYRLAYYKRETKNTRDGRPQIVESRSTLPVFMNVVFDYKPDRTGSCREIAQLWKSDPLTSGALAKDRIQFKQLELNLQVVRFPSGQKTDFGGQAIYLFRIFQMQGTDFVSIPLENTPNVGLILQTPDLKADLIRQLSDRSNIEKIDNGTFVLENTGGKMLATRALSFSTTGRARLANKPYTAIFGTSAVELAGAPLTGLQLIASRKGFVERLNNLTCAGCHQNGGTAGFHMLGHTRDLNSPFNQVIVPFSAHYHAERVRRTVYNEKIAQGETASSFRPLSFYPAARWSNSPVYDTAQARDLCVPSGKDFISGIDCGPRADCRINIKNASVGVEIGECVAKGATYAGHVCRDGVIASAPLKLGLGELFNLEAFKDKINIDRTFSETCGNPSGGVPLGRISKKCEVDTASGRLEFVDALTSASAAPIEMCAMRGGPQFDECAKTANPPECLANARIVRSLLDTCSVGRFCREDYICQRLPEGVSRLYSGGTATQVKDRLQKLSHLGIGFCVPNYFVFNMRADGHIIPEGRIAP